MNVLHDEDPSPNTQGERRNKVANLLLVSYLAMKRLYIHVYTMYVPKVTRSKKQRVDFSLEIIASTSVLFISQDALQKPVTMVTF